MRTGFDWSGGWPGIPAIQAQGGSFAGRYLVYDHPRGITAGEVAALNGAGMDIIAYYEEQTGSEILQGASFGTRAAHNVLELLAAVGVQGPVPVNLTCDIDIASSHIEPVFEALDAFAAIVGRQNTGIYGGVVPVHLARSAGKAAYAVQAGAWRYRANEVGVTDPYGWSPYAQVRQDGYHYSLAGTDADHLSALAGDFGQWRRPGPINPVPPDSSPWDPHQFDKYPSLRQGMNNSYVETAKFILNYVLNSKLAIDINFDHDMYQAVYFWQGLAKLTRDGIIGTKTWESFDAYVARVHRFDREPVIKFADVGHAQSVKDAQMALNAVTVHGFTPLAVSGSFGASTRDCVYQYQRNRHLVVDGIVGRNTWSDLGILLTRYGR